MSCRRLLGIRGSHRQCDDGPTHTHLHTLCLSLSLSFPEEEIKKRCTGRCVHQLSKDGPCSLLGSACCQGKLLRGQTGHRRLCAFPWPSLGSPPVDAGWMDGTCTSCTYYDGREGATRTHTGPGGVNTSRPLHCTVSFKCIERPRKQQAGPAEANLSPSVFHAPCQCRHLRRLRATRNGGHEAEARGSSQPERCTNC